MMNPVEVNNLCKNFYCTNAVKNVNLQVKPGEVYGLLGRNGAGKTTLLRLLLGILDSSYGVASIYGKSYAKSSEEERQRVAYISQDYRFYNSYTLQEFVSIHSPLYKKWSWDKADYYLKVFELEPDKLLGDMSGGQRQKVSLLFALSCGAELLILDEPAAALDPLSRRLALGEMMNFVADDPEKNTIIFSTHIVNDLERVATRVGMMDKGQITHEFEIDDIHDSMRKVQFIFPDKVPDDLQLLSAVSETRENNMLTAICDTSSEHYQQEIDALRDKAQIQEFTIDLEEFFVQIYGVSSYVTVG